MSYETIRFSVDGPIALLRLHRPERMNAVIEQMYRDIADALGLVRDTAAIRCLILTGSVRIKDGVRKQVFCAGADLKKHSAGERSREQRREYIELAHATVRDIWELPKPVIAAVNGPARGAGAELALACDLMLMAEQATLGLPEIGLGTFVGGGVTYVLPRLVGLSRAKELVYTGRVIDGREAVAIGLALQCHPLDTLQEQAAALARRLVAGAPIPMTFAKRLMQESAERGIGPALERETEAILACMESEDWKEGLRAFAEKRDPAFEGK